MKTIDEGQDRLRPGAVDHQHLSWLARSFGANDYLPLSTEDLQAISGAGEIVTYSAREHLFRQGEPSEAAFVVTSGTVELYRGWGVDERYVARLGPGAVVGDIALFCGEPYFSSAKAATEVVAVRFARARLMDELSEHPTICFRWLVSALNQLKDTQRRVIQMLQRTVKSQVADLLLQEADESGSVELSQAMMATLLGAGRQSVNQALRELVEEGSIDTGYRMVRVLDEDRLRSAAEV